MTIEDAAQAAADRDHQSLSSSLWLRPDHARDLYVRAFRQGAQWQMSQLKQIHEDFWRALTGSDSPQDPRTAAKD